MLKVIRNALIILSITYAISSLVVGLYLEFRPSSFSFESRSRNEIRTNLVKSLLHFVSNLQIPALGFFFAHKISAFENIKALRNFLFFMGIALFAMVAYGFVISIKMGNIFTSHIPSLVMSLAHLTNSALIATMCIYAGVTLNKPKNSHPNEIDS